MDMNITRGYAIRVWDIPRQQESFMRGLETLDLAAATFQDMVLEASTLERSCTLELIEAATGDVVSRTVVST